MTASSTDNAVIRKPKEIRSQTPNVASPIGGTAGQVVFSADGLGFLGSHGLEFGTIGNPVAETTAISTAAFAVGVEAVHAGIQHLQEWRHLLLRFHEQMLQIEQDRLLASCR